MGNLKQKIIKVLLFCSAVPALCHITTFTATAQAKEGEAITSAEHSGEQPYKRKITIHKQNAELDAIFKELSASITGIPFLYNSDLVKGKKSTVSLTDATLDQVLEVLLANHRLGYQMENGVVVIFQLPAEPEAQTSAVHHGEYSFTGRVIEKHTGIPVSYCNVAIINLNVWGVTNDDGDFALPKLRAGEYTYEVSFLGYQKHIGTVKLGPDTQPAVIELEESSLALESVVVTARETKMGSTSLIDETAIQHIQAKSVQDMLQLVPGNLTTNPSLNTKGQAYVREIEGSTNNALGMAVIIDGSPVSTDSNMQTFSTATTGINLNNTGTGGDQTVAGRGVDLRTISPDNIESVEVIRGIPSVEYGDMATGGMIIKTRAGATPLEIRGKTDQNSQLFFAGKGFQLGKKLGTMNMSADYSQSYNDIRLKSQGFNRITGNIGYSNTFWRETRPLTLNVRAAYYRNINEVRHDPQMILEEKTVNGNQGIRISAEGNWQLNTKLVSNLSYTVSYMASHQEDYYKKWETVMTGGGNTPYANTMSDGEYVVNTVSQSYYSEYTIDGKPRDLFAQLKAGKFIQLGSGFTTSLKAGAEYKHSRNEGEGLVYNESSPPSLNQPTRPRSNKSIPALNNLSFFIEDRTEANIGTMKFIAQGGVRFSKLFLKSTEHVNRNDIFTVEPRVNMEFNILNTTNNSFLDDLSIVGGYGITSKMPTLLHLYPNSAYFDKTSYLDGRIGGDLAVMTTRVINDTSDPDLKPTRVRKFEAGIVFRKKKVSGNITFFNEKHTNGFSMVSVPVIMDYNYYTVPVSDYDAVEHRADGVYYKKDGKYSPADMRQRSSFFSYNMPANNQMVYKHGIEYAFNFGQIPALRTSLVADGAWLHIESRTMKPGYSPVSSSTAEDGYPYYPLYPAGISGLSTYSGIVRDRVNTNLRFITHIPSLKMVFSTTFQIIWYESSQYICTDADGNDLYYYRDNGPSGTYYINPLGFLDRKGEFHAWQPEYANDSNYRQMVASQNNAKFLNKEVYPINMIVNFRLTKQFGKVMEFSFIANNFLQTRNIHRYKNYAGFKLLSLPFYFGAEIMIKL